jgi:hypothetical protein
MIFPLVADTPVKLVHVGLLHICVSFVQFAVYSLFIHIKYMPTIILLCCAVLCCAARCPVMCPADPQYDSEAGAVHRHRCCPDCGWPVATSTVSSTEDRASYCSGHTRCAQGIGQESLSPQ